ncbi:MAG: hypothetical protein R3A10_00850 [Caldilineaceae bacterium]
MTITSEGTQRVRRQLCGRPGPNTTLVPGSVAVDGGREVVTKEQRGG